MKKFIVSGYSSTGQSWISNSFLFICNEIRLQGSTDVLKVMNFKFSSDPRYSNFPKCLRFIFLLISTIKKKFFEVPKYGKALIEAASSENIDQIIVNMDSQANIWLAQYLVRNSPLKVLVITFFSVETIGKLYKLDRFSIRYLQHCYQFCVRNCEVFQSSYFEIKNISKDVKVVKRTRSADKIVIGIIGYPAHDENVKKFVATLDSIYWELDGKKLEIIFVGDKPPAIRRTRLLHRENFSMFSDIFSDCDILYFPDWFETSFVRGSELCSHFLFTQYLAANIIVFFHGARSSEFVSFLENTNRGIICGSLDEEVIKFNLRKAVLVAEPSAI